MSYNLEDDDITLSNKHHTIFLMNSRNRKKMFAMTTAQRGFDFEKDIETLRYHCLSVLNIQTTFIIINYTAGNMNEHFKMDRSSSQT